VSDVTAAIVFHAEGLLAPASIASYRRCCEAAARQGIKVTRLALLDRPDRDTLEILHALKDAFDLVETVDNGDPGATRNDAVALAATDYAAFFDGDDLWGEEWLTRAHRYATEVGSGQAGFHPRVIAMFSAQDYAFQSASPVPASLALSHFMVQQDSRSPGFDPRSLLFCNIWSVNTFGSRSIYERYPFPLADRAQGFGIEDWWWNLETLTNGIEHVVVPDTVHCIRMKGSDSVGAQHALEGLLPPIHRYASHLDADWEARSAVASRESQPSGGKLPWHSSGQREDG
jgi:hypothetical protein